MDVRIVSATNQPLSALVKEGRFREDLYYRLNEIRIELPPLRERDGDAVVLAQHFRNLYNREHSRNLRGFTKEALVALQSHEWPGNVRELENRVKRAVIMSDGPLITAERPRTRRGRPAAQPQSARPHARSRRRPVARGARRVRRKRVQGGQADGYLEAASLQPTQRAQAARLTQSNWEECKP